MTKQAIKHNTIVLQRNGGFNIIMVFEYISFIINRNDFSVTSSFSSVCIIRCTRSVKLLFSEFRSFVWKQIRNFILFWNFDGNLYIFSQKHFLWKIFSLFLVTYKKILFDFFLTFKNQINFFLINKYNFY